MLEGFTEFNYLSAQKVRTYRAIMRVFYDQYLLQRSTIRPRRFVMCYSSRGSLVMTWIRF